MSVARWIRGRCEERHSRCDPRGLPSRHRRVCLERSTRTRRNEHELHIRRRNSDRSRACESRGVGVVRIQRHDGWVDRERRGLSRLGPGRQLLVRGVSAVPSGSAGSRRTGHDLRRQGSPISRCERLRQRVGGTIALDADTGELRLAFAGNLPPSGIPTTLIVDRDGRVAARVLGFIYDRSMFEDMLDRVVAEVTS